MDKVNYGSCEVLKRVRTIGKYLAILPQKNSQSYIYPICCVVIHIAMYALCTFAKIAYASKMLEPTVMFTGIVSDFCLTTATITSVIWVNVIKGKNQSILSSNLQIIDYEMHGVHIKTKINKVRLNSELIFVHVLFFVYYVYCFFIWTNSIGFSLVKYILLKDLQNYHILMLVLILRNYALAIKYRSEAVNGALRKYKTLVDTNLQVLDLVSKETEDVRSYAVACLKLRKVRWIHHKLIGLVELYNNTFGWCFVTLYINIVFSLLGPINIAFVYGSGEKDIVGHKFGLALIMLCMIWCLLPLVSCWAIFSGCKQCSDEMNKTGHICHTLVQCLSDVGKEGMFKKELKELVQESKITRPEFTAAGFFVINYNVLFSLIGSISSYLIVLIQFSR